MRSDVFDVMVLTYGDHPDLAARCLGSILSCLPDPAVSRLWVGMNAASPATAEQVAAHAAASPRPCRVLDWPANIKKYPALRRLLEASTAGGAEWVMWFDDDSFVRPESRLGFFTRAAEAVQGCDAMGVMGTCRLAGNQHRYVEAAPWYGGRPVSPHWKVRFLFGGWWCVRREVLARYGWPPPELLHRGGDVLFGELCRQQGLRMRAYNPGVAVNADASGQNHRSPRRGYDEPPLGVHTRPTPPR
jgi:hypothetical protein